MEQAGFRTDLNAANNTLHARGARIHVLPFGVPNFNHSIQPIDGSKSYTQDARDIDTFLFNFRQYLTFSPVGNDGDSHSRYPDMELGEIVFVDPANAQTYQVNPPATAKNTVAVGSSRVDEYTLGGSDTAEELATRFVADRLREIVATIPAHDPSLVSASSGKSSRSGFRPSSSSSHALQDPSRETMLSARTSACNFSIGVIVSRRFSASSLWIAPSLPVIGLSSRARGPV